MVQDGSFSASRGSVQILTGIVIHDGSHSVVYEARLRALTNTGVQDGSFSGPHDSVQSPTNTRVQDGSFSGSINVVGFR